MAPRPSERFPLLSAALDSRLGRLRQLLRDEDWASHPESLHQVRIASRRARAVLDLMAPDLPKGLKRCAKTLRRLTRILGQTRELDVHAATLQRWQPDLPLADQAACHYLLGSLDHRRGVAREHMARQLEVLSLAPLEGIPPVPASSDPVPVEALRACLAPRFQAIEARLPSCLGAEDVHRMHRLRIQVKCLRYALEILEPAMPASCTEVLTQLKALQDALGAHHDHALLEACIREAAAFLRPDPALGAGLDRLAAKAAAGREEGFDQCQALAQTLTPGLDHLFATGDGTPS